MKFLIVTERSRLHEIRGEARPSFRRYLVRYRRLNSQALWFSRLDAEGAGWSQRFSMCLQPGDLSDLPDTTTCKNSAVGIS